MEWLDPVLRVLVVIGLATGAYRSYRKMRSQGAWSTLAIGLSALLILVYLCGGVLLVTGYGVFMAPRNAVIFALVAAVYLAGGLYVVSRAAHWLQTRHPPRPPGSL